MSSNRFLLAFANDAEISGFGFQDHGEAVAQYSVAAANGFVDCRFVPFGFHTIVDGVEPTDYVLCFTGVTTLRGFLGPFGDRPRDLRGWLIFSNCNYFLEELDFILGERGGGVTYVDNYLCGANGKPVLPADVWVFQDYFGEEDSVVIDGVTYSKAWNVVRNDVPYQFQSLSAIVAITYCSDIPHTLRDGTSVSSCKAPKYSKSVVLSDCYKPLFDACGSPFVTNGTQILEVVPKPIFAHSFVQCRCGLRKWTVGDWTGYKSTCCGISSKVLCTVFGDVTPGDVLITSARTEGGTRYYNGLTLKYICTTDNVACWRVLKCQGVDGFVATASYDNHADCSFDPCVYHNCTQLASAYKLALLTGNFGDIVVDGITTGVIDVGTAVVDVVDRLPIPKPGFVTKCGTLFDSAWSALIAALKEMTVMYSDLLAFLKKVSRAVLTVCNGVLDVFIEDVPEVFKAAVDVFKTLVIGLFDLAVETVVIAGERFPRISDFALLSNAIVQLVSVKPRGPKQTGLKKMVYAAPIVGVTKKVTTSRVEVKNIQLYKVATAPFVNKGYAVVVNGIAYFFSGGVYRLMADHDAVYEEPIYCEKAECKPVFKCDKPEGFPDLTSTNPDTLAHEVKRVLDTIAQAYDKYVCRVLDGTCVVEHSFNFKAPGYISDKSQFVALCKDFVTDANFPEFYRKAHSAASIDDFHADYAPFEIFKGALTCPDVLKQIDDGSIFDGFIKTVNQAYSFVKNMKVTLTIHGVIIETVKRFKRFAGALARLYSEYMNTIKTNIVIGGVSFVHYAFVQPVIVLGDVFVKVSKLAVSAFGVSTESCLENVYVFDDGVFTVAPTRVQTEEVVLNDCDEVVIPSSGYIAVVDGHTFYTNGEFYFPATVNTCHKRCFKRGGGKVAFSEVVDVKPVNPVYKVKLIYEFEDEVVKTVCEKAIGNRLAFEGDDWDDFVQTVTNAVSVVGEFVDLPNFYVYDEEGGNDLTKPIMVSQWALSASTFDVQPITAFVDSCGLDCDFSGCNSLEDCIARVNCTTICLSFNKNCGCGETQEVLEGFYVDCTPSVTSTVCLVCKQPVSVIPVSMVGSGLVNYCEQPLVPFDVELGAYGAYRDVCYVDVPVDLPVPVDVLVDVPVSVDTNEVAEVASALSFIEDKPVTFLDPFKFDYYDHCGVRVLKQESNNCWVASAIVHLQLFGFDNDAMLLFKAGSVSPLVKLCYTSVSSIVGSLGDAGHCLENLLKDYHTMFLTFDVTCNCGISVRELSGAVFQFMPTRDPFKYGVCTVCKGVLTFKLKTLEGTGIFCQEPKPFNMARAVVKPTCASVYVGKSDGGHYKTNLYEHRVCVDGSGVTSIASGNVNTVLIVNGKYGVVEENVPAQEVLCLEPFEREHNVEFYQGDLSELVKLPFDFAVNAANESLQHAGGVAKAFDSLTHGVLQRLSNDYIKTSGKLKVGKGVMLECPLKIFNVVGPRKGTHARGLLVKCYKSVFANSGIPLTPLISVGIFGVPISDSLIALMSVVGDRCVKCFCHSDNERKALVKALNAWRGSQPQDVKVDVVEQQVQPLEITPAVSVVDTNVVSPEPILVSGGINYYAADLNVLSLGADTFVLHSTSTLELCDFGLLLDKHFDGSISAGIIDYKKSVSVVPAGNLVTFKCGVKPTIVLAVFPTNDDVAFQKNLKRTIAKISKLKGFVVSTFSTLDVHKRVLTHVRNYVVSDVAVVKQFHETPVTVKVSEDGRTFKDVVVSVTETVGSQLGDCVVDNVSVSSGVVADAATVVNVAPSVDWDNHYGFKDAAIFHMLDHSVYDFDSDVADGKRVLVGSDNNCWVNATCIQLQFANVEFVSVGLTAMWNEFVAGKVSKFVHWLYWLNGCSKGDLGDVENTLNIVAKYTKCKGHVTISRATVDGCCSSERVVDGLVVNASILRAGTGDGFCPHGNEYLTRVVKVDGTAVIVNVGEPLVLPPNNLISGISYTAFSGPVDAGHYRVFNAATSKVFDGMNLVGGDLCNLAVTSVVVVNKVFKVNTGVSQSTSVKIMNKLDSAADTFFSAGDVVSHNIFSSCLWFFTMLGLLFRAFKTRDFRVFALAPERTGIIFTRSLKYNFKAARHVLKRKQRWVTLFLKFCLLVYTCYAAVFMLIRFGPPNEMLCKDHVTGYANSTFVKDDYCNGFVCKVCLFGYQELADLPHTAVAWKHIGMPFFVNWLPMFYLAFLFIFGGFFTKMLSCYFVAQYVNSVSAYFGMQDTFWPLHLIPFNVFGDELVVCFIVTRVMLFVKHICFGCDKASCVACCKSARLTRVPMQTIVCGANKSFYVTANGGRSYCTKHNFFCVNCDSYGPGNTFINETVARELSNVVKASVQPTGSSYCEVDKVEFSDGFYYLYCGETFDRYNFDITESKYSCKEALKSGNVAADFIVYNDTGTNVTQIRNACVYYSQLLCKPIKLVNASLLSSLNVDFNGALHSAFVQLLSESFSKDLSNCTTLNDCKQALGFEVSDEEFLNAVSDAHRHNVLLSDISHNNLTVSYAKPEEKLSVHDIGACMRFGAKVVNHNVLVKENVPIVWLATEFHLLSEEGRKYLIKTAKAKGVTFLLTFNSNAMNLTIPTTSIVNKRGAGVGSKFFWWICGLIVAFFFLLSAGDVGFVATSFQDFGFKYIKDGVLHDFEGPLDCVHNVFDNFDAWHDARYGVTPINRRYCPIVVGTMDNIRFVPNVASGILLVGKTLVFAVKTVFTGAGNCYGLTGLTTMGACLFNSACTNMDGLGGPSTYCYKTGLVDNARLYSDLTPHHHYKLEDGNFVKLPEIIAKGFGFVTLRTMETTYCRIGECLDSKAGVCFGLDRFFVYNTEFGGDYICGSGVTSFFKNVFSVFTSSFSVMALSGQVAFNCIFATIAVILCFLVIKFKRMFGDLSYGVCTVVAAVFVNNVSYILTQNMLFMFLYAIFYFLAVKGLKYAWIWHLSYVIAYFTLAPWFLVVWYVGSTLLGVLPALLKLKISTQLFEGDKFVGNFESAAYGTFVLDMHSYERLANSISMDKVKQYAATFNKYKYYSGSASEADYRCACFAHLAKAMLTYADNHCDVLYTPPSVSYNSTLQSGLRKWAQPSGVVEKCVVRVCYGNMALNGIWLGDTVICPRHVMASSTNTTIDYDHEYTMMRLHNFSVSVGSQFLGVIGVTMKGVNLCIKVNQTNPNTPTHSFKVLKPGDSFNILACYDGVAAGVYGTTMRTNFTIRGSFINGACGSVGYNVVNNKVEFCYLHQLELGSGCHVGSDFNGNMYGKFQDQPSLQVEGANQLVTANVLAFLYGGLLNGINWFVTSERLTCDAYNEWAHNNGFTNVGSIDGFNILAAKTGVDVQRMLAAIQNLSKGFGGRNILGYMSLTDEFTVAEVVRQMYGVNLQSRKLPSFFNNVALVCVFWFMFISEMLYYTSSFWIKPSLITPVFVLLFMVAFVLTGFLKHKVLFLYTFLIPGIVILATNNLAWDCYVRDLLLKYLDYHMSLFNMDIQGVFNIAICFFVNCLHTWRFVQGGCTTRITYVLSLLLSAYNYWFSGDVLSFAMMLLLNINSNWYIGAFAYKFVVFVAQYISPASIMFLGNTKVIIFLYVTVGYFCCVYFGLLYWLNRFFKFTMGVYDFKVSAAEFKYMVANDLSAPSGVFDALLLSFKLIGIGGEKTIKVSTVQSKLTDIKCTNVVMMGCLTSMNIEANSKDWAYCVELHNKINLTDDPEKAMEYLLALLTFFLSRQKDFNCTELLDSYFADGSILQSVAATFVNMPSFIAYETARQNYEDALNNGSSPQLVKQLKRAMNIAKSEYDHEAAVQRKINRMAEQAASQMYKEARAVNRKAKVISSLHALLFGMLKKLDMSSVDTILNLARDGVVPLSIIPATCATKLVIVASDFESYKRIYLNGNIHYAGTIWTLADVKDNDGKPIHIKEITDDNTSLVWPLVLNCERVVKLQNNEIIPGKLKQRAVKAEGDNGLMAEGKALYNTEGGNTFMYAFITDKPDLKYVKWEFDAGCKVIELEPPCRFAVSNTNGTTSIRYLYFVKNLNTLRRGSVLGYIGATVRLQAGKQTELVANSSLLTLCSFAVDPAKCYIDAVKSGVKPVGNCVKMLSNGSGSGQAITVGVEANTNQDSYGGASVCLYCRAHVDHPTMDGFCRFRGRYVQVPLGTTDPIRFCLENDTCKVCHCWLNNGCTCDRTATVQSTCDTSYLNEYGALVQLD